MNVIISVITQLEINIRDEELTMGRHKIGFISINLFYHRSVFRFRHDFQTISMSIWLIGRNFFMEVKKFFFVKKRNEKEKDKKRKILSDREIIKNIE